MVSEVDVVIPTFRRPEALASCLKSLESQTLAPASIEVVDDSETDYGPGTSRNIGWNKGSGRYVAFIDDDCMNLQVVDGKIVGVEITCQKPYLTLPNINIINEGIGAILRPIMSSTPTKTNTDQTVLQSVDCVGAYPKPGEN